MAEISGLKIGQDFQRTKTHCKHGHPLSGDNLKIRRGWRICITCERAQSRKDNKTGNISAPVMRRIIEAANSGASIRTIEGYKGNTYVGGRIIAGARLREFCRNNPKLGNRLMKKLAENGRKRRLEGGLEGSLKARLMKAPSIIKSDGAEAYETILIATRDLSPTIQGDVQGDMFVALAEGRLKIADIPRRVREFVTARNRADRNSVFNPWGHLSLDKPLNDDSDATFMDVIREDQRLWA